MLFILAKDESSSKFVGLFKTEGILHIGSEPYIKDDRFANLGKQVTYIKAKDFEFGEGIRFDEDRFIIGVNPKPHSSAYFCRIAEMFKPKSFECSFAKIEEGFILLFEDTTAAEFFIHERLTARPAFFNDKNDDFNFIVYPYNREVYLTQREMVIDVTDFTKFELEVPGASVEDIDTDEHFIPVRLSCKNDENRSEDILGAITDTYKIKFDSPGMYIIKVSGTSEIYKTQHFAKVYVI